MDKKKKINLIVVGCLLLTLIAAVFTVGCPTPPETTTPPPAEEHLTVGVVMPISGPISTIGMAWVRGYELYFDKLNAEGGVQIGDTTYFIDVVSEDSLVNPEAAGTAAQKLVFQDGATFVFGCILEQCTQAVYDICAPNGVLHLVSWVNVPFHPADISPDKPLAVRPMISPQDSHRPILEYLLEAYPETETLVLSVFGEGDKVAVEWTLIGGEGPKKFEIPCVNLYDFENGLIKSVRMQFDSAYFAEIL